MVTTSVKQKFPDSFAREQTPYWVEIQLVDEEGKAVPGMPWQAENSASHSGHEKELKGQSDAGGLIKIEMRHGSELTFSIDANALAKEMEKRFLRISREPTDSLVRKEAERNGYIWHYAVIGELCRTYPDIEKRKGEPYPPPFHFPRDKSLKGFKIRTNELEKRHVIEICPFRTWELILHHQKDYSMANAINLGVTSSLAYVDDNFLDTASITQFFITQCQNLSQIPKLHKDKFAYNALVQDVPFSDRYFPPVFMDTSRDTSNLPKTNASNKSPATNADGDTQLFYVYNNKKVIIAWRGTAGLYDIGTDLVFRPIDTESCNITKTQCTTLFEKGKVHAGFWSGYCRVDKKFQEKIKILRALVENLSVFICGHSLGGALALIHAAFLKNYNPLLYTYGMPRTFTRDAVGQLANVVHFRHVNNNDPIPAVPPEANVDNVLYELWGPIGGVLGGVWSTVELAAWQLAEWGDCFWHHGKPVVFLTTTQSREWKDCKTSRPQSAGCITIKKMLPIKVKLYLVPALAEQAAQEAGKKQKTFNAALTKSDLDKYFPDGKNPERGADLTFGEHFMTAYMPYINNKLLELIDAKGLSEKHKFTEHHDKIKRFQEQMSKEIHEIPKSEFERNIIFFELESLLENSLNPTLSMEKGSESLERFAYYGEEEIEDA
ncbi:lipase family protein [Chimaeribacter arupi]|uniref:lipase family protein n=1 Tax=Yersiniaceae TaxID=1903411 RepID=UPI0009348E77|nr:MULTISPECIES: lipase family protein [Yersiniaceae]PLR45301.1 lipase family protein [Chimaeribacter arupi]